MGDRAERQRLRFESESDFTRLAVGSGISRRRPFGSQRAEQRRAAPSTLISDEPTTAAADGDHADAPGSMTRPTEPNRDGRSEGDRASHPHKHAPTHSRTISQPHARTHSQQHSQAHTSTPQQLVSFTHTASSSSSFTMSGLNTTNPSAAAGASARGAASAAAAGASVPRQDTLFVSGEGKDSVSVQSQLATATIEGDVTSHSNIGQVVSAREAAEPISGAATGLLPRGIGVAVAAADSNCCVTSCCAVVSLR